MIWKWERVCFLFLVRSIKKYSFSKFVRYNANSMTHMVESTVKMPGLRHLYSNDAQSVNRRMKDSSVNSIAGKLPHPVCQVTHARVRMGFLGNSIGIEGREQWVSEMCNNNVEISSL